MKRREAREKTFQFLFQIDFTEDNLGTAAEAYLEEQAKDKFLHALVQGSAAQLNEIDGKITAHLENWSLSRLPSVERAILRLATYEVFFMSDIPPSVSINEAVELGNIYGDEKTGRFINGVLSKMIKEGGSDL